MKCIFAATPYQFAVQYHACALVASHAEKGWVISIDGVPVTYHRQDCRDSEGRTDLHCAVFVPAGYGRRAAGKLLTAFNAAHPGIIPTHLTFQFNRVHWWLRARHGLPARPDFGPTSGI